jgi:hypothetical protein
VGTMLAQIEQATKVMSAAHQGMCDAQAKELELLWTCSGKPRRLLAQQQGRADMPVRAMTRSSTKVMIAAHMGMCDAQVEELELLLDLFRENPELVRDPRSSGPKCEVIVFACGICWSSPGKPKTPLGWRAGRRHPRRRSTFGKAHVQQGAESDHSAVEEQCGA